MKFGRSFRNFLASDWADVGLEEGNTLLTELGHHVVTSLFSFENKNLLLAEPQNTAAGSPSREVLKTSVWNFVIRSKMNFSG